MREYLLGSHFTDKAKLERFKGLDDFNKREYEDVVEIDCRIIKQATVIKSLNEESIVSTVTINTFVEVGDMDRINGKDVLAVEEKKSLLDGQIVSYKVLI